MRGSKGFEIGRPAAVGVCLCAMVALLFVVSGCGEQLTRMEENQIKLQAMMAANAREIATLSSQVHHGAGKLTEGIQNLDAQDKAIAAEVQTVRNDQRRLHETVVAGNQGLDAKVSGLQESQRALHDRVAQVQDVTGRTASDLTTLAQQHTALHETVQTNQRELNKHVGVVVSNQQGIQAGVARLQQAEEGLARDVASVAGKQDALSAAIQDHHGQAAERLASLAAGQEKLSTDLLTVNALVQTGTQSLDGKLAVLEQNQRDHRAGIERVASTVTQTATAIAAMAAAQTAMQESLNGNYEQIAGRLASLTRSQQSLQGGVDTLNGKVDRAASDSATAASSLQETMRISREVVTGQMAASLQNQQSIQAAVQELNGKTDGLTAGVAAISTEQAAARETSKANQGAALTAMAGLSDGQQALRDRVDTLTATAGQTALSVLTLNNGQATFQQAMQAGMNGLHERADRTAADVHGMAERQDAFQQSIKASNESLTARTAAIVEGQQALKVDLGKTAGVIDRAYADLTAVAIAQETLQTALAARSDEISSRVARVENSQKVFGDSLDVVTATTGQTALDVLGLSENHADLHRSVKTGNEAIIARTTALDESQKALGSRLDVLTATTGQTALDVLTLNNDQSKTAKAVQNGLADLRERTDRVANNQQQTHNGMEVLTATTGQTALDVLSIAGRQDTLHKAIQSQSESADARMAKLADNQQRMHNGIEVLTATAGQTALDVIGMSGRQDALQQAIRSQSESTDSRMVKLAEDQQKMQSGLDAVAATTGKTARDVVALSDVQTRSEQAAQAGRTELAGKLAAMTQDQQSWLQRFDAAQSRLQAMADGMATLDQQLAKLQGSLQGGLQSATTLLSENGQQRQQFEAKVAQDMQAVIDAIAQLRQAQALLQEQMSQVQKNTQSQADTLKATIDQIRQPPVEAKVSDAKPVEPAVVETGE